MISYSSHKLNTGLNGDAHLLRMTMKQESGILHKISIHCFLEVNMESQEEMNLDGIKMLFEKEGDLTMDALRSGMEKHFERMEDFDGSSREDLVFWNSFDGWVKGSLLVRTKDWPFPFRYDHNYVVLLCNEMDVSFIQEYGKSRWLSMDAKQWRYFPMVFWNSPKRKRLYRLPDKVPTMKGSLCVPDTFVLRENGLLNLQISEEFKEQWKKLSFQSNRLYLQTEVHPLAKTIKVLDDQGNPCVIGLPGVERDEQLSGSFIDIEVKDPNSFLSWKELCDGFKVTCGRKVFCFILNALQHESSLMIRSEDTGSSFAIQWIQPRREIVNQHKNLILVHPSNSFCLSNTRVEPGVKLINTFPISPLHQIHKRFESLSKQTELFKSIATLIHESEIPFITCKLILLVSLNPDNTTAYFSNGSTDFSNTIPIQKLCHYLQKHVNPLHFIPKKSKYPIEFGLIYYINQ